MKVQYTMTGTMKVQASTTQPTYKQKNLIAGTVFRHTHVRGNRVTVEDVYMKTEHGAVSLNFQPAPHRAPPESYLPDDENGDSEVITLGRMEVLT